MTPRALAWFGIAALAACRPSSYAMAPPEDPTLRSLIVLVESSAGGVDQVVLAAAAERGEAELQIVLDDVPTDARLTALVYTVPLASLGLTTGPLPRAIADNAGRPLPSYAALYQAPVEPPGAWTELETPTPGSKSWRLPPVSDADCVQTGGCPVLHQGTLVCDSPCPDYAVLAPSPPELPKKVAWPCPPGWRTTTLADEDGCVPPPDMACPAGETVFLGADACAPIGGPCPAGTFGPAPAGAIYVDDAGGGGGAGTALDPYHDLFDALNRGSPGDVYALSKGSFARPMAISASITLIGACSRDTSLLRSAAPQPVITVVSGTLTLRNLGLRGGGDGLALGPDASVELEGVALETSLPIELAARSRLTARDVLLSSTSMSGVIRVRDNAALELSRVNVDSAGAYGLWASGSGAITASDLWLRGLGVAGPPGGALVAEEGARIQAQRVEVSGASVPVLTVLGAATASISDAVFLDDPSGGARQPGALVDQCPGLPMAGGAQLSLTRGLIRSRGAGVLLGPGCSAALRDLIILDGDTGVETYEGAALEVTRVVLGTHAEANMLVSGTPLVATDLRVAQATPTNRYETLSVMGSTAQITRAQMSTAGGNGITLYSVVRAVVSDLSITGQNGGCPSFGLLVSDSTLEGERVRITDCTGVGVRFSEESTGQLSDLSVSRTGGEGLSVDASKLSGRHYQLRAAHCYGALFMGSVIELSQLEASDTSTGASCLADLRRPYANGSGVGTDQTFSNVPQISLDHFLVSHNQGNGLIVRNRPVLELQNGAFVSNAARGLSLPGSGFKSQEVSDGLIFIDNGDNSIIRSED